MTIRLVVLSAGLSQPSSTRLLADRVGHSVYVSSRSVYTFPAKSGMDERAPVVDSSPEDDGTDYARAKRGGELAAEAVFGDRALFAGIDFEF